MRKFPPPFAINTLKGTLQNNLDEKLQIFIPCFLFEIIRRPQLGFSDVQGFKFKRTVYTMGPRSRASTILAM